MVRVLVTGATGFIGSHLVEALAARGDQVRCLVRDPAKAGALAKQGAELMPGTVEDADSIAAAVAGVDTVFHVAGIRKALTADEMLRVNRDGTRNVAQACADLTTPPRLVIVSSVAAAGPARHGQVRIESDPPAPVSIYGRSKLAGEEAARRFADRVPTTVVRPGIVFGPRDLALLKMFRMIRMTFFHASPGWFPPPLSYIYVSDLVDVLLAAEAKGGHLPTKENGSPAHGRYFAAAAEYPSYAELGRMVRPLLKRSFAPVIPVASPVAWCIAGATEMVARLRGQPDEFGYDKLREALVTSWACSSEAAQRDLGFAPKQPLAERLRETIDWYWREGLL